MEINKEFFDKYLKLNKSVVAYNGNNEAFKNLEYLGYPIDSISEKDNPDKVKTIIFLEIVPDSPKASIEEINVADLDSIRIYQENNPSFTYKGIEDDKAYSDMLIDDFCS